MAQQLEPAQQVADLRSQFFPIVPSAPTQAPNRTRLTEGIDLDASVAASQVLFYVQCNCGSK